MDSVGLRRPRLASQGGAPAGDVPDWEGGALVLGCVGIGCA